MLLREAFLSHFLCAFKAVVVGGGGSDEATMTFDLASLKLSVGVYCGKRLLRVSQVQIRWHLESPLSRRRLHVFKIGRPM